MCQNLRPKHLETNTNDTRTTSTRKMYDLIGNFISTTGNSGKNCFLKLFVLNKGAISPETVEFSGKIRSQVLQVALETNCPCGLHLIAWKKIFSSFFVLIFE